MDLINFLISINKISFIAFIITLSFLIYEIILFKRDSRRHLNKINLPQFNDNLNEKITNTQSKKIFNEEKKRINKPNNIVIIILIIISFLFGLLTIIGFIKSEKNIPTASNSLSNYPTQVEFVNSKGIRIFDKDFKPIPESDLNKTIKNGETIFIGIETIPEVSIDRARIRVNKNNWDENDITVNFSKEFNVFYKEFDVASDSHYLKIEAQLHSSADGWLGE